MLLLLLLGSGFSAFSTSLDLDLGEVSLGDLTCGCRVAVADLGVAVATAVLVDDDEEEEEGETNFFVGVFFILGVVGAAVEDNDDDDNDDDDEEEEEGETIDFLGVSTFCDRERGGVR